MARLPALFVGHGSPSLTLEPVPARDFLAGLGRELGRPKAILAVSAHWETAIPEVGAAEKPETIHDFFGFPEALYRLDYPAPGSPALADRAAQLLGGFGAAVDRGRGLDHGIWAPLRLMYPEADIPVVPLSIQPPRGAEHHLAMGRALAPLRDEGVLVMATGAATHNLRDFGRYPLGAEPAPYARAFDGWLADVLERRDEAALVNWKALAPEARRNHPSDEHFLPLIVAQGAGGAARRLHASFTYGFLSMAAYAFD
jgi:4,5-DOPA dioxygenase extradiol